MRPAIQKVLKHTGLVPVTVKVEVLVIFDAPRTSIGLRESTGLRWYQVWHGSEHVGDVEHVPSSARDRRWMAWFPASPGGVASASGYRSMKRACQALAQRAADVPPRTETEEIQRQEAGQ